ncbi:MAG: EamA family transporter [archaeon]|nr:EamA family transporter [archaeon]
MALAGTAAWAICNLIDKYLISGFFRKPAVPLFIGGIVQIILGFLAIAIFGFDYSNINAVAIVFLSGFLGFVASFFYFKALVHEEVSRVIPVMNAIPIWVVIIAIAFLGEAISALQGLGILLLLTGAVLVSLKKAGKWELGRSFKIMLLASVLYALEFVLLKYGLGLLEFWNVFFWSNIGFAAGSMGLFVLNRAEIIETLKRFRKESVLSAANESLSVIGYILIMMSFAAGLVSLSTAITVTQPVFVLVFATSLSIFWPRIIKEELRAGVLALKIIAIGLTVIGSLLLI